MLLVDLFSSTMGGMFNFFIQLVVHV